MNPIQAMRSAVDPAAFLRNTARIQEQAAEAAGTITNAEMQGVSTSAGAAAPSSFGGLLGKLVGEVSAKQSDAASAVRSMLAGDQVPLHHAMIAMEEANVSFQLMVEVRNKLLESYQELMRMQI